MSEEEQLAWAMRESMNSQPPPPPSTQPQMPPSRPPAASHPPLTGLNTRPSPPAQLPQLSYPSAASTPRGERALAALPATYPPTSTTTPRQEAPSGPTPPPQRFALGTKVKIMRSGGTRSSVCTVVGLPEENDFGLYTAARRHLQQRSVHSSRCRE